MSEKRWALLIGIDIYEYLPEQLQLHGCVNDTMVWMDVLTSASYGFGFPRTGITQLTNKRATREGILAAFDDLVARVGPDDVVFVGYSGHGSQMREAIAGSEPDGLDETIVPGDAREPDNPDRKDITDNELNRALWSLAAKTARVTMVFDSCHSASVTRDLLVAPVRGIDADLRPPTPEEAARAAKVGVPAAAAQPTVLAGCREDEESHELREGPDHGALTWFLTRALAGARPGATYRDVFEAAAAGVTGAYPNQHPQIDGAIDRELFGILDRKPMRFLPVTSRSGNEVTLGGGAAQTVDVGSRWAAYPPGTLEPEPAELLATLVVTKTGATTATATGESGAALPDGVAAGARVVREATALDEAAQALGLRVGVPDDAGELASMIGSSTLLERVAPDDSNAYARVFTVAPRDSAPPDDPVPDLPRVTEPTVAVVGPDGHLLVPPRAAASADAQRQVVADLETFARYKRVVDLENPGSRLAGAVEMELLRKSPNGGTIVADPDWVVAASDPDTGTVVFEEGDLIGVRLTSRDERPLYPALLDLSLTYDVAVFPECAGKSALDGGLSLNIVSQWDGSGYPVSMDGFPFVQTGDDAPVSGIETLKLFVTTQEADYTFLAQEGVSRAIVMKSAESDDDWTTVTRQFTIRRGA
jgi:hypothetical protein